MSSHRLSILLALLVVGSTIGAAAVVPGTSVAQQQSGEVIGQPDISFSTASGSVSAGTAAELDVAILNRGRIDKGGPSQHEATVTTARGMTMTFDDSNVPIDVRTGQVTIGQVPRGSMQRTVPITIAETADPGTYKIPIEYEYQFTRLVEYDPYGTDYGEFTRERTGSITIEVTEDARFEVVETNATAQIGDRSDVSLTLRNVGTQPAADASVVAESRSSALTFESGAASSNAFVGEWRPGETRTINYTVSLASDAARRGYTLDLSVNYEDTDGIAATSEPMTAGVTTLAEQSFAFEDVSSSLRVGEDGEIEGTVRNTGPQTADSVIVQYADDSSAVIPVEESVAVGSLGPGEAASFSLPIEVSSESEAGAKSIGFAVSYRNQNGDRRAYDKLDVTADVAPERDQFDVSLDNATIESGGSRTLSVAVTNNLDETASDVEARLFADDPLDTGTTDTGYVQSIEPGETVTVTFELTASASATPEKTYPISFDFRYDDADGNSQISNTVRVPVDVVEAEEGGLPIPLILGAILGLVVIAAVVRYRRQ
ncbi:COG1361 S-layer family protein [Halopenitus persicus]|uniref:Sialidase-1 n=1 Tax=Halopenitus persicus TaxID=1048396 RepID=A0A1H3E3H2_9EURY|nr:COG1361 S-layer family protein [Halopenitus persicus]SDX73160.1 sialidase-1 [Halopenitus persicus]